MNKREEFIGTLKEMKNTNLTYKKIAERLNVKTNTLYTWIQKGNVSEKKAAYLMKQLERCFPEEYVYAAIMSGLHEVEKEIREARAAGNALA